MQNLKQVNEIKIYQFRKQGGPVVEEITGKQKKPVHQAQQIFPFKYRNEVSIK